MCGFVVLWRVGDEALASRMIAKIAHRGPDATQVLRPGGAPIVMAPLPAVDHRHRGRRAADLRGR